MYGVDYWSHACRAWVIYLPVVTMLWDAREIAEHHAKMEGRPYRVVDARDNTEYGRWTGEK
jgi:hypothetical protein